jgi:hypothetical protein
MSCFHHIMPLYFPRGATFVGTGSGTPKVPELPSARVYKRPSRPQGGNSGDRTSRLGVRPAALPWKTHLAMKSQ